MTSLQEMLLPKSLNPVQKLVESAGVDVSDWAEGKAGQLIAEGQNAYKNFLWAFEGIGAEPVVLCVWHREVAWDSDPPRRVGNSKQTLNDLNMLAEASTDSTVKRRLRIKVTRAQMFGVLVRKAFIHTKPVKVILLEGKRAAFEDAAEMSSQVNARELDPGIWWVHKQTQTPANSRSFEN